MDANEDERRAVETVRPPLVPSEKRNVVAAGRARIREVSSRYKSASISAPSTAKRCPSPLSRSITTLPSVVVPNRAVSTGRERPSSPISPSRLSTPSRDIDVSLSARKMAVSKKPERLWPSTMRNLSFSSEFDGCANHPAKKENHIIHSLSDLSLRLSSNASNKQPELCPSSRKATADRKRSPLKGKSFLDHAENFTPTDSSRDKSVDQHRWPGRKGGKIASTSLNRNDEFTFMIARTSSSPPPRFQIHSPRRLSEARSKPTQKISSYMTSTKSFDPNTIEIKEPGGDLWSYLSNMPKSLQLRKQPLMGSSEKITLSTPVCRSQSLPSPRHPFPIRTASQSKVLSPSHSRPAPGSPRGPSPSRIRPISPYSRSNSSSSILSFIADFRKPKKSYQLENAHQFRLLHNRHLQWRFANARTDAALRFRKMTAEVKLLRSLHIVWRNNLALWDSVINKRIRVQLMRLELKLNIILNEQMLYLDEWASLEKNYSWSLAGIIKDLEASTLRLPLTEGSRADIKSLKFAVSSAMDVMQLMGPSVVTIFSRVCELNNLVSRLADLAVQERAMLNECQNLLALNSITQVEERSLRTHLIQTYMSIDRY